MTRIMLVNGEEGFHAELYAATISDEDAEIVRVTNHTSDPTVAARQIVAREPDLVVVGADHGVGEALDIVEALDEAVPSLSSIIVAEPEADTWQRALRAGARDLLPPDASVDELAEAIKRAEARSSSHPAVDLTRQSPTGGGVGRVLAIVSPKGGCGKTMLATNLAYGLQTEGRGSVVIVDFDLQFGDVASSLGLRPEYTVSNAIHASGDVTTTKSFLTAHPSGLFALCAPLNPAEADNFEPDQLAQLLFTLQAEFDWVVVDTSAGISEPNLVAIEAATDVMVVATTDLAAIQAMRKAVTVFDQIELTGHNRWFVLNRANARVGLDQDDIE